MIALYKDPQGKNVFKGLREDIMAYNRGSSGTTGSITNTTNTVATDQGSDSELIILRERVTQLEEEMKLYKEREGQV